MWPPYGPTRSFQRKNIDKQQRDTQQQSVVVLAI